MSTHDACKGYIYSFLFSTKIQDGRQKWQKLKFLNGTSLYYLVGQKFTQNHFSSYSFPDIYTFLFSAVIQDGRQKWQKFKFSLLHKLLLYSSVAQKIHSKLLYLLRFLRYFQFLFITKIQDGRQNFRNLNFSFLHRIIFCYRWGRTFTQNWSIFCYGF